MQEKLSLSLLLISLALIIHPLHLHQEATVNTFSQSIPPPSPGHCTSFCLDNSDYCVLGTNMDHSLESGYLCVNKRHVMKTTWDPSASGEYARRVSKYGSVTVNFVSYQMVWGGMNEAGLMISTMSLNKTQGPKPDERLPL
jgi:penicillin V acylase-like amidase (Ntn superfamily)